jgi:Fe-S cluster assembly protein SufD
VHAQLDKNSKFISNSLINSEGQARNEVRVNLLGQGSSSNINVLMMGAKKSMHETLTKVKHATKNTKSEQIIRTILDERSRGSFQGKIRVDEGADGTLAEMSGKSLLLSNDARINSKPELEILADDVKCSHGVTVGTLSKEQLFYLQSRGIPENEARKLLINSFSNTIINNISNILIKRAKNFILGEFNEND